MEHQFVVFTLTDQYFGVAIALVERIIEMRPIARVPFSPDFIQGLLNLEGQALPVLDLRRRFGFPASPSTRDSRIVVVVVAGVKVGMIVDRVTAVLAVSGADLEPLPPIVATVNTTFITGVAKAAPPAESGVSGESNPVEEKQLIILLNLRKVLSTDEKAILQGWEYTLAEEPPVATPDE